MCEFRHNPSKLNINETTSAEKDAFCFDFYPERGSEKIANKRTILFQDSEVRAVQKYVDLVDLVKNFATNIEYLLANFGADTAENEPLRITYA